MNTDYFTNLINSHNPLSNKCRNIFKLPSQTKNLGSLRSGKLLNGLPLFTKVTNGVLKITNQTVTLEDC
jgi:hypothetical protein